MRASMTLTPVLALLLLAPAASACGLGSAGALLERPCPAPYGDPVSDACHAATHSVGPAARDAHAYAGAWYAYAARPGTAACAADATLCPAEQPLDLAADWAFGDAAGVLGSVEWTLAAMAPFVHREAFWTAAWNATLDDLLPYVPVVGPAPFLCGLGYETPCALANLGPAAQRDATRAAYQEGTTALMLPGYAYDQAHAGVKAADEGFDARTLPCPAAP